MQTLMEHNLFWRLLRSSADKDVIFWGFCLDGFTPLSVALGACLTKALTHRLHPDSPQTLGRRSQRSKERWGFATQSLYHLYSLLFGFLSVHLLFIKQLHALDFLQTLAISGHNTNSASGLLLNRLSSDNRFHVEAVIEKSLKTNCRWSFGGKVELLKWPSNKLTASLYDDCVELIESTPKTKDLHTISCTALA